MKVRKSAMLAAVLCGLCSFGAFVVSSAQAGERATPGFANTAQHRLLTVQNESRSYLEGRGFQSYQRDRGFSGQRQFGTYPSRPGNTRDQRRLGLDERRLYGPSQNRCADWSRRCDQRTSDGSGDYTSCMRYHGCR
jgi:hypothetical protein